MLSQRKYNTHAHNRLRSILIMTENETVPTVCGCNYYTGEFQLYTARCCRTTLLRSVVRIYIWNEIERGVQCRLLHWQFRFLFSLYAHKHAEHFLKGLLYGAIYNTAQNDWPEHSPRNGSKLYANTHWWREKYDSKMLLRRWCAARDRQEPTVLSDWFDWQMENIGSRYSIQIHNTQCWCQPNLRSAMLLLLLLACGMEWQRTRHKFLSKQR